MQKRDDTRYTLSLPMIGMHPSGSAFTRYWYQQFITHTLVQYIQVACLTLGTQIILQNDVTGPEYEERDSQ